jgi:hypothetical protein
LCAERPKEEKKMIFLLVVAGLVVWSARAQTTPMPTQAPAVVNSSELDGLFALYNGIGAFRPSLADELTLHDSQVARRQTALASPPTQLLAQVRFRVREARSFMLNCGRLCWVAHTSRRKSG